MYNSAYGGNARVAGWFPLAGNYTTTIRRPTVLGWAFSLPDPTWYAGFTRILRVPGGGRNQCPWWPVRLFSALCSLKISAHFSPYHTHIALRGNDLYMCRRFWFAARSGVADHQAAAKSGDAHGIQYTPWRRLDFTSAR